ncbi:MAG: beta-propeller domain-containing protein [Candidatus Peregrinibacteria bacterium]
MRCASFLALLLVLFIAPAETFAGNFLDIGGKTERPAIEYLQQNGILNGYQDGSFRPDQQISRAEFLKIILSLSPVEKKCTTAEMSKAFSDVTESDWFAETVCNARKSGIINGYSDGTFHPHQPIDFAEASKIAALALAVPVNAADTGEWYKKYMAGLEAEKTIATGISPSKNISRGEMAQLSWSVTTGNEVIPEGTLPKVDSCSALNRQLEKLDLRQGRGISDAVLLRREVSQPQATTPPQAISAPTAEGAAQKSNAVASDFSTTNIQEYGVDEADIVKNDGSHIFIARHNEVRIVKAFPSNEMKEESKIKLDGIEVSDMFLDMNRLVVMGSQNSWNGNLGLSQKISKEEYYGSQKLIAKVFDITDRSNPKEIRSLVLDGNLVSSRKIGNVVYIVANAYLPYSAQFTEKNIPQMLDSTVSANAVSVAPNCAGISYIPNFSDRSLTLIAALDIKDPRNPVTRETLLGAGNNIYASSQNLFVTRQTQEQTYRDDGKNAQWQWETATDIFKFSLDGLRVTFAGAGKVSGYAINQFAMSEDNGFFRIATTQGDFWRGVSINGIHILDGSLKEVSKVDNLAKGEKIHSVRFMGNKAYMVTFKNTDPLFVVDLTPTNPKVLGELKIPGYSDYLHPYDETHLIGFGKDAVDAGASNPDFAYYQGMKISMFDVADLAHPKELFTTKIGDRGTNSELLIDHKALLFDRARNLLAFPVSVAKIPTTTGTVDPGTYGDTVFQGAYFYDINLAKNEFTLRGTVTHFPPANKNFYDENYSISRILRLGENFYTTAKGGVKALNSTLKEVKSVSFLGDIACSEIYDGSSCSARADCAVVWYTPECPAGKMCAQVVEFQSCQEKK